MAYVLADLLRELVNDGRPDPMFMFCSLVVFSNFLDAPKSGESY